MDLDKLWVECDMRDCRGTVFVVVLEMGQMNWAWVKLWWECRAKRQGRGNMQMEMYI